jgi:hypothetical protein
VESAAQEGREAASAAATDVPINVRRFMGGILLLPSRKRAGFRKKEGQSAG